jgi:hypothetical protein
VVKSAAQPLPNAEELQEAYALASRHTHIGVNLGDGQVIRALDWREARPELFDHLIFPVPLPAGRQPAGLVHRVRCVHRRSVVEDTGRASFSLIRGTNGSGLELRYVDYRGQRVLYQAHLPILNVLYNGITLQYRDWTTSEAGFDATGTPFQDANGNNLSGFLYCSTPPQTIFETGHDGSFYGVASYENAA